MQNICIQRIEFKINSEVETSHPKAHQLADKTRTICATLQGNISSLDRLIDNALPT
jgi:hypothetical protein